MKLQLILFISIFVLLVNLSYAQSITNVTAKQDGKKITIYYTLTGKEGINEFTISLFVSTNGGTNWEKITGGLTGDIGEKINPGNGKIITWDVLANRDKLQGDNVSFKVLAAYYEGGVNYTETKAGVSIEMVYIKGGTFTMGCTNEQGSDCEEDEKPAHSVTLSDYYIGKYEVTQKQWTAIMGNNPSYFKDCGNCPVETVSYNEIQDFLQKLNQKTGKKYSLPTEAQWEYAARGGVMSQGLASHTKYAGSNAIGDVAWFTVNSGSKTHPVGQKNANELGIFDMSGNVWEWCSDWYNENYYKTSPQNNPENTSTGSARVLRGGSWSNNEGYCRVANRNNYNPGGRFNFYGFRLVLVPD